MNLPHGFFDEADVAVYRALYANIPLYGKTAELGSFQGRSICSVADIIRERHLLAYCVDTFKGTGGSESHFYEKYKDVDILGEFKKNTEGFGFTEDSLVTFVGTTDEAAGQLPNDYEFVFIDADHTYDAVKNDIKNWLPKVRKGGILAGDDYTFGAVRDAVKEAFGDNFRVEASIWIYGV